VPTRVIAQSRCHSLPFLLFPLIPRRPPGSARFPYTTLFRSHSRFGPGQSRGRPGLNGAQRPLSRGSLRTTSDHGPDHGRTPMSIRARARAGRDAPAGWLFTLPIILILGLFLVVPVLMAAWVSISDWSGRG